MIYIDIISTGKQYIRLLVMSITKNEDNTDGQANIRMKIVSTNCLFLNNTKKAININNQKPSKAVHNPNKTILN